MMRAASTLDEQTLHTSTEETTQSPGQRHLIFKAACRAGLQDEPCRNSSLRSGLLGLFANLDAFALTQSPVQTADLHRYLDASRVQALHHLFDISGQQGIDLFMRLLARALTPPEDAPPSQSETEASYAAQMSAQSIMALGHLIGCKSQETMTKYVQLFKVCGLIETFKVKHSRRVYLQRFAERLDPSLALTSAVPGIFWRSRLLRTAVAIPKGPYVAPPTLLSDLDAILARRASRPKVKALVRQIRDRSLAHGYINTKMLGLVQNPKTFWGMGGFGDTPNPEGEASPSGLPSPTTSFVSAPALDEPSSPQHILATLSNEQVNSAQRLVPLPEERVLDASTPPKQHHPRRDEGRVVQFHNKRAEMVALPATLTRAEWKMTLEYFHYKCADFQINDYQVFEHVIPLTSGGGTTRYNCIPACVSCNSAKGDQHPSMLPPSSWIATTLPHVQKYLKTRERAEGMDS